MGILKSDISPNSAVFKANAADMKAQATLVRDAVTSAALGGGERSRERHLSRGKLLPRDRVQTLLDPGSPFLEIGTNAAHGMYDGRAPGQA